MGIPFTIDQFLSVFEKYNLAVWPMQIILYPLAVTALYFTFRQTRYSQKFIALTLSFLWLWTGLVYHLLFFTSINKAAYLFAGIFIIQSLIFFSIGVIKNGFSFHFGQGTNGIVGIILVIYALIIYPLLGLSLGHFYPKAPTFPLPCPLTIFTFGLLLSNNRKVSLLILVIPLIWSLIGFSAALSMGILEDIGLPISGITAAALIYYRQKKATM
jgi:hypothetical protein